MPDLFTDPKKVAARRMALGWSMAELARQAGVSYAHVRKVNDGESTFGELTAPRIAAALGCTVADISNVVDYNFRRHAVARRGHTPMRRPGGDLSEVELRIVAGLAEGVPISQIAAQLGYTAATVSTYVANARKKVGARTREQLVATAIRDRLLGFDRDGRAVA